MLVKEYERMFTKLSKYFGSTIRTEEERCRKFEKGLHKEIRTLLMAVVARAKFSELIDTTLQVEQSLK